MANTPCITTSTSDFLQPGPVSIGTAAADKISFYGVTKVVQPSGAGQAAVATTAITAIGACTFSAAFTGMWAFASSTVAKTLPARINQLVVDIAAMKVFQLKLRTDLVALGLIKGSA
jgi:hypothetical protein